MNLMTVEQISKFYGEKRIFENLSFGIETGDKIGVIGINGTGKSTLLKAIAGIEEVDRGKISRMRGLKTAYLPQTPVFERDECAIDYVLRTCAITDVTGESEAKTILTKIGIDDIYARCSELSGGQRKKIAIAAALIAPVDLLILDEPTNHIDTETIAFMEGMLKKTAKALLLVTHDRYFLDRVVKKTLELDGGRLYVYHGNYSQFLELKAQREDLEAANERKRQSFLRRELEWVKRGAKARTTKQKARLDRFEKVSMQQSPLKKQEVQLTGLSSRLGRKTIELRNISKDYDGKIVIKDFGYTVLKGDRIGIIGPNGSGKTTLLNIISGKTAPSSGSVEVGETVKIGFFSQESNDLDREQRVIDYIKETGSYIDTSEGKLSATKLLERFLFTDDMQYSPIGKLSGGEKRRLFLMKVLMSAPNILLLDEPTNDLDIETLRILEEYLEGFDGAVITVSHDRYFLDRTAQRIFSFEGEGKIKQYEGGYYAFEEARQEPIKEKIIKETVKRENTHKPRMSYKDKKEYESIESEITAIEEKIAAIDDEMRTCATNYSALTELTNEKEQLEKELEQKTERWLYLEELAQSFL